MRKVCPECGNFEMNWDKEKGEIICRACGLVVDDKLVDFGQEWREFGEDGEKFRRSGAPLKYTEFDQGLLTSVGNKQDIYSLKGKDKSKFIRLRTWQNRVSTSIERNLRQAMSELKRVSSFLKLSSSIEEEGARIYTLAVQKNLVRGRAMEAVVAGALYAACRRFEHPRSLDEFAEAVAMERKDVGRTYRFVVRELELKILPSNPLDYLPKFISTLKLDAEVQSYAAELVQKSQELELTSGRTPNGIAAAAVYAAATIMGKKRTQRHVADAAGITEVTIRNRFKELESSLGLKQKMHEVKVREKQVACERRKKLEAKRRAEKRKGLKKKDLNRRLAKG
jgi:transcription initiation factor TFIIB